MAQTYGNYYKAYEMKNTKRVSLNLSVEKDADIIKAIGEDNKQGKIKELVRAGIESMKKVI